MSRNLALAICFGLLIIIPYLGIAVTTDTGVVQVLCGKGEDSSDWQVRGVEYEPRVAAELHMILLRT